MDRRCLLSCSVMRIYEPKFDAPRTAQTPPGRFWIDDAVRKVHRNSARPTTAQSFPGALPSAVFVWAALARRWEAALKSDSIIQRADTVLSQPSAPRPVCTTIWLIVGASGCLTASIVNSIVCVGSNRRAPVNEARVSGSFSVQGLPPRVDSTNFSPGVTIFLAMTVQALLMQGCDQANMEAQARRWIDSYHQ